MFTVINGKELKVKKTGNRYFYYGRAMRWLPIAKSKVVFK